MKIEHKSKLKDPPAEFLQWWEPSGRCSVTGADTGGHPEAERVWARKDEGRWTRRTYGIKARIAWNTLPYQEEYLLWVDAGSPEREEEFIGLAVPLERQKKFWQDLKPVIERIGKPMPKVTEGAIAFESDTPRTPPDP